MMEPIPPKTRVPDDWIHPALKKQLMERGGAINAARERMELLEKQRSELETASAYRQHTLAEKERKLEKMDRLRHRIAEEIQEDKNRLSVLHYVYDHLGEQLIVQKTKGKQKVRRLVDMTDYLRPPSCFLTASGTNTWGRLIPCFTANKDTRHRFFCKYAQLFTVIESESMPFKKVTDPVFFDEMCLMETEGNPCMSSACPYWHCNQLEHVKMSFMELFTDAVKRIKGYSNTCDVASTFASFYASMKAATELVDAVRIHRDFLNCIANFGWAAILLEEENEEVLRVWDAPRLRYSKMSLQNVSSLIRDLKENEMWGHILQTKSTPQSTTIALFKEHGDELSWRCLMRVAGTTIDRLLWLATRGVTLFPTSPHIRLTYLSALLKSGCAVSDCVEACISSSQLLSDQTSMSTFSQQETQCNEMTARYIAYMVAMTCVHVADTDPEAAIDLLEAVLKVPGHICLLPLAMQNLTLFLVVLLQTNQLEGVNMLPLASISDVSFIIGGNFPQRPREKCTQILSRQLNLLRLSAFAGIHLKVTEFMRSVMYISLMHAFSTDVGLLDRILTESPMHSSLGLATVWAEYLCFVEQRDGTQSLISLVHSLTTSCESPLVMLYLVCFLRFHGENVESIADTFLNSFEVRRGISLKSMPDMVYTYSSDIPTDEWIPLIILYSLRLCPRERLEMLIRMPLDLYTEGVELFMLLWLEMIHLSVVLRDDTIFRQCLKQGLLLLREPFLHYFSPIDSAFDDMISYAHLASLIVYRAIPVFLGTSYQLTRHYRGFVLQHAAELHVLHPYLLLDGAEK